MMQATNILFRLWLPLSLLSSLLISPTGLSQTPLQDALAAIDRGDYTAAEAALSSEPQHLLLRGILQFHRGRYDEAEATLAEAVKTSDDPRGRTFRALAQAATGKCGTAAQGLARQFEEDEPTELSRLAGIALVQCYFTSNQLADAFPVIARLSQMYPDDADVLYQTAKLHMKAWNEAVFQMFQKDPASFRVNQISAEIFEIQGRFAEAVAEYRKAIQKSPHTLNLHFRLGRALLMQSHAPEALNEALKQFQAELQLNPNDAIAEYQIAQILTAQQKPQVAAEHLERALELEPKFPEALIALGKTSLDEGKFQVAIDLLRRALALAPQSEAVHYNLMIAYRNSGRQEEAQRHKAELERLQQPPEGEFTEFLKKLGEKPSQ